MKFYITKLVHKSSLKFFLDVLSDLNHHPPPFPLLSSFCRSPPLPKPWTYFMEAPKSAFEMSPHLKLLFEYYSYVLLNLRMYWIIVPFIQKNTRRIYFRIWRFYLRWRRNVICIILYIKGFEIIIFWLNIVKNLCISRGIDIVSDHLSLISHVLDIGYD